jgi:hypothetical protein
MDTRTYTLLKKIEKLVGQALGEEKHNQKLKSGAEPQACNSLPGHILGLKEAGFFKQPKTSKEVHEKLQSTYPCDPNRVAMALLRLQRQRKLRKASKIVEKKLQAAYVQ